ncbi:hypothetical protein NIES4101_83480 [Calothrix sp. NIES-4101]|nr:hypothetical protein NIES4101_83480 [Calothrix sp. NIES-4101]
MKSDRIRVELWASLRPAFEKEMEATGLSAPELINFGMMKLLGVNPFQGQQHNPLTNNASHESISNIIPAEDSEDDLDFL